MKITIIGAHGFVGSELIKEAVSRGHEVTGISRTVDTGSKDWDVVSLDVMQTDKLSQQLKDQDAVISAFNPGWSNPHIYEDFMDGSRSILQAAREAGVPRLLVVGGAGSLYVGGKQLVDSDDFPAAFRPGASAARDFLSELRGEKELDWVFLSPPIEFGPQSPVARRGLYRVGLDEPIFDDEGRSTISASDLAVAILDEIETPAHHKQRFTVGY